MLHINLLLLYVNSSFTNWILLRVVKQENFRLPSFMFFVTPFLLWFHLRGCLPQQCPFRYALEDLSTHYRMPNIITHWNCFCENLGNIAWLLAIWSRFYVMGNVSIWSDYSSLYCLLGSSKLNLQLIFSN